MKTIKELRAADALKLAQRLNPEPTAAEIETATKAMRAFYRYAAAFQAAFFTEQDHGTPAQIEAAEEKEARAYKKAADGLARYNLRIACPGLNPIITEKNGAHFTLGHYYN